MILAGLLNPQWLPAQAQDLITKWCYLLMNLSLIMLFVSASHNVGQNRRSSPNRNKNKNVSVGFIVLRKQLCNP